MKLVHIGYDFSIKNSTLRFVTEINYYYYYYIIFVWRFFSFAEGLKAPSTYTKTDKQQMNKTLTKNEIMGRHEQCTLSKMDLHTRRGKGCIRSERKAMGKIKATERTV